MKVLISSASYLTPLIRRFLNDDHLVIAINAQFKQSLGNMDVFVEFIGDLLSNKERILEGAFKEAAGIIQSYESVESNLIPAHVKTRFEDSAVPFLYPRLGDLSFTVLALEEVRPDLVILHNDVEPLMRVVAEWARVNGVPCLHVPHAVYIDSNRGVAGSDVHDIVTASHIAAFGPYQATWYALRGNDDLEIKITGSPRYDSWASLEMSRKRARALLKLDQILPVLVYGGTWRQDTNLLGYNDDWADNYVNFLQATKYMNGVQVVIKLHPRTTENAAQWYADTARKEEVECTVTMSHLPVVLAAADIVYAPYGSNLLLEATYIPDVRLATTYGYENDREVLNVENDVGSMKDGLWGLVQAEPRDLRQFQYKYLGIPDGQATSRVYEFCEEICASIG